MCAAMRYVHTRFEASFVQLCVVWHEASSSSRPRSARKTGGPRVSGCASKRYTALQAGIFAGTK